MSLSPGAGRISLADNVNRGIFFRLALPVPFRVWSGRPKIRVAANDLDAEAEVYTGIGSPTGVPELDRMFNGEAQRCTITIPGLSRPAASIIESSFADLTHHGVQARFGHLRYDRLWRPTQAVRWIWDGILDEVTCEVVAEEERQVWTVELSLATALVDANRPPLRFWTPQNATAGDLGFNYVPGLNDGTTRIWPPR